MKIDREMIKYQVRKALEWQFCDYSWNDMIDDCDLTKKEKKWAKENLTYDIKAV